MSFCGLCRIIIAVEKSLAFAGWNCESDFALFFCKQKAGPSVRMARLSLSGVPEYLIPRLRPRPDRGPTTWQAMLSKIGPVQAPRPAKPGGFVPRCYYSTYPSDFKVAEIDQFNPSNSRRLSYPSVSSFGLAFFSDCSSTSSSLSAASSLSITTSWYMLLVGITPRPPMSRSLRTRSLT